MSNTVVILRALSLVAFVSPMLRGSGARRATASKQVHHDGAGQAPVAANFAAFALFFLSLAIFPGDAAGSVALLLASAGLILAIAGGVLVARSRAELGPAWSFAPKADEKTGIVVTAPYRLVRHPIYLLAMGEAVAFSSCPAFLIVLWAIIPTFAWRAWAEEGLLSRTFGERYIRYRKQTKMMIPYLF